MNKRQLQERRNVLLIDYHIVVGHLQEVDYWLERAEAEEAAPPAPVEDKQATGDFVFVREPDGSMGIAYDPDAPSPTDAPESN